MDAPGELNIQQPIQNWRLCADERVCIAYVHKRVDHCTANDYNRKYETIFETKDNSFPNHLA